MTTVPPLTLDELKATYHAVPTRGLFAHQMLLELGAPVTLKNMIALTAWMAGENTKAKYNPLATTHVFGGSTPFNSAGVQNYPNLEVGIRATIATIKSTGHGYEAILTALANGQNIQHVVSAVIASAWGTGQIPWSDANNKPEQYAAILLSI